MKICTGCGKNEGTVENMTCDLCLDCYAILRMELDSSKLKGTGPRFFASFLQGKFDWFDRLIGRRPTTIGCGLYISKTPAQAMGEAQRIAARNGWTLLRLDIQRTLTDIYVHKLFPEFHYGSKATPVPFDVEKYGQPE